MLGLVKIQNMDPIMEIVWVPKMELIFLPMFPMLIESFIEIKKALLLKIF